MKHLLSGVAIAAALVVAAPVWAQAPTAPAAAPEAAPAAAPMAGMAPMAGKQRHKRMMHHMDGAKHMGKMGRMSAGDAMTSQLNREELARIGGGGAMPPAPPPPGGAGQGGPRPSGR